MKRAIAVIIRAVAVLAYLIFACWFLQYEKSIASKTYNMMRLALLLPTVSVLFGVLLRCDVFFSPFRFRADWLSLLLLGLPSLLLAYFIPLGFTLLQNVPLPNFVSLLWANDVPVFAGTLFGYTLINGLFEQKTVDKPTTAS